MLRLESLCFIHFPIFNIAIMIGWRKDWAIIDVHISIVIDSYQAHIVTQRILIIL